jgi:hypothetical protein
MAIAAIWQIPMPAKLGRIGATILRAALLAALVFLPLPSRRPPTDPVAVEHRLVVEAAGRMEPGTLVVVPRERFEGAGVIADFPSFLLPGNSRVALEGDPSIDVHRGPRLNYLGLACVSWDQAEGHDSSTVRPECAALRTNAHPWLVRSLRLEDLPRTRDGEIWTFHRLATGVPFGFFAPDRAGG